MEDVFLPKPIKAPTTYAQQIALLKQRGCKIRSIKSCEEKLKTTNYYRLQAYFLPFKNPDDTYKKGTSFEKVYRIYEFDAKLRHILFSALEEIEIYLRSTISYFHAHKHGAAGYLDRNNFSKAHDHKKFTAILPRTKKHLLKLSGLTISTW